MSTKRLTLPVTTTARRYGYIYWPIQLDGQVRDFLGDVDTIELVFRGADLGKKNVDWKYRRISIGYRWTRNLPEEIKEFVLTLKENNQMQVLCR